MQIYHFARVMYAWLMELCEINEHFRLIVLYMYAIVYFCITMKWAMHGCSVI